MTARPHEDLDAVLAWWQDEARTGPEFRQLRREVAKIARRRRMRAAVEESALNLLSTPEEQTSDRASGGRAARQAGFDHVYGTLEEPLRRLLWNFALADAISLRYQRPQAVAGTKIAAYVGLAGTGMWLFNRAAELVPGAPVAAAGLTAPALAGAVLLLVFTLLSLRYRVRYRQLRHRFLAGRTLAETLRVEFFQRLAGTGFHTVEVFTAHHETSAQPSWTLRLLEHAIASAGSNPREAAPENPRPDPTRLQWVESYWIEAQHRQFGKPKVDGTVTGATGREAEAARKAERWLRAAFLATAGCVVGSVLLLLLPHAADLPWVKAQGWPLPDRASLADGVRIPRHVTELLAGLLGIAAAGFHQRSSLHAVTARKFRRAALVLAEARHHLSAPELTPAYRQSTFRYVAYQSIAETTDWGVHQREQPMHVAFR
jgi:hypothetical protein